jgi:hypothetical protein
VRARQGVVASTLLVTLSPRRLVVDIVLLCATGALAMFVLLLSSQIFADAMIFQSALRYAYVLPTPPAVSSASDVAVDSSSSLKVARAIKGGSGGAEHSDLTHSIGPTVWAFDGDRTSALATVLAGVMRSGSLERTGAVLDQATAASLHVSVGDDVYVDDLGADDVVECRVRVTGLVAPYRDAESILRGGLVILSDDTCPTASSDGGTTSTFVVGRGDPGVRGELSHTAVVWQTFRAATAPHVSGLLLPILAVGLVFWVLAAFRAATQLRQQLARPGRLLIDLGVSPRAVRAHYLALVALACTIGAVLAGILARSVLFAAATFFTQPLHVATVVGVFALASIVLSVRVTRRFDAGYLSTVGGPHD